MLATLHTNSAVEAITRFQSMGITPHDIITSISLIVSQRLLRKLCKHCKKIASNTFYKSKGCEHCLQGYKDRIAIYEFFQITEKLSELIVLKNIAAIRQRIREEGFSSLYESGMELVQQGITSKAELDRVVDPIITFT